MTEDLSAHDNAVAWLLTVYVISVAGFLGALRGLLSCLSFQGERGVNKMSRDFD